MGLFRNNYLNNLLLKLLITIQLNCLLNYFLTISVSFHFNLALGLKPEVGDIKIVSHCLQTIHFPSWVAHSHFDSHKIEPKNEGCGLSMDTSVFGVLKNLINIHKTSQDVNKIIMKGTKGVLMLFNDFFMSSGS